MSKVQSKRGKKAIYQKEKTTKWILFTLIYGVILMYLYGMSRIYFPDPIHVGFGQYFDIGIGILFFGLLFYMFIIGVLINKLKKRN